MKNLLKDKFEVVVKPGPNAKIKRSLLRDLKADKIG